MKKIILPAGMFLLTFALLAGCTAQKKEADTTAEEPKEEKRVCCESYGYGSEMKKCCETYEWVEPGQCGAEEGIVGGGKEVVDDSKCE